MLSPEILEVNSRSVPFWVIYDKESESYLCPKGFTNDYMFMNLFASMAIPFINREDAEKVLKEIKDKLAGS